MVGGTARKIPSGPYEVRTKQECQRNSLGGRHVFRPDAPRARDDFVPHNPLESGSAYRTAGATCSWAYGTA